MIKSTEDEKNHSPPLDELEIPEPNKIHIQETSSLFSENLSKFNSISEEFKECHSHVIHRCETKNSENKISNNICDNIIDKIFFLKKSKNKDV